MTSMVHFSVQQLPGSGPADWEAHMDWDGESVPFTFRATMGGAPRVVDTATLRCAHANVGDAPPEQQPRMRGVR